jgi:ELWxxDGT repeat protein
MDSFQRRRMTIRRSILSMIATFGVAGGLVPTVVAETLDERVRGIAMNHQAGFKLDGPVVESLGVLYFAATTIANGSELWRSDGTVAGTHVVRDIGSGAGSSWPRYLTVLDDQVYFAATSTSAGRELWATDGTLAGTVQVADLDPGSASGAPRHLHASDHRLYFSARDVERGRELWQYDPGVGVAAIAVDVVPGPGSSSPRDLAGLGSWLYFFAQDAAGRRQLWRSDGSAAGTATVAHARTANGSVFFAAAADDRGEELWRMDVLSGPRRVADILPGARGSIPRRLAAFNNRVFFSADDDLHGRELWVSDGTESGTMLVADIRPGPEGSDPASLSILNDNLVFVASDDVSGRELWLSDGTNRGTLLLADLWPGAQGSEPRYLTAFRDQLYFRATDASTNVAVLWRTDGTRAGTVLAANLHLGSTAPAHLVVSAGLLRFRAVSSLGQVETWVSDGTPAGTAVVAGDVPGTLRISWVPPTRNTDGSLLTDLAGYELSLTRRLEPAVTRYLPIPDATGHVITGLVPGLWYIAARAVNRAGVHSEYSRVVSKIVD